MKTLNLDSLSSEATETVLIVLDLIAQIDDTVLVQKDEQPLYTLSRIGQQNSGDETGDMKPSEIFKALEDKFDQERLDEIEQRRHPMKTL